MKGENKREIWEAINEDYMTEKSADEAEDSDDHEDTPPRESTPNLIMVARKTLEFSELLLLMSLWYALAS